MKGQEKDKKVIMWLILFLYSSLPNSIPSVHHFQCGKLGHM